MWATVTPPAPRSPATSINAAIIRTRWISAPPPRPPPRSTGSREVAQRASPDPALQRAAPRSVSRGGTPLRLRDGMSVVPTGPLALALPVPGFAALRLAPALLALLLVGLLLVCGLLGLGAAGRLDLGRRLY